MSSILYMKALTDYGLMSFRASAIYFVIIQGFGYLVGTSYSAFQLFGLSLIGVALFNIYNYARDLGGCALMDEREMIIATSAAAYGFISAIFAISLDHGQIYSLDLFQVARISYAVFLTIFLGKAGYHRFGGRLR